jgi:hypothetical protein
MGEYIADCNICKGRNVLCKEVETKDKGEKEFKKEYWCQSCYEKMMEEFMEIQEEEMYEYYRSISSYRY